MKNSIVGIFVADHHEAERELSRLIVDHSHYTASRSQSKITCLNTEYYVFIAACAFRYKGYEFDSVQITKNVHPEYIPHILSRCR